MKQNLQRWTIRMSALVLSALLVIGILGCGAKNNDAKEGNNAPKTAVKTQPDQMTDVNFGLSSKNVSYLPIYVAEKKGLYKKYNLNVKTTYVTGAVLAIRGLQSGDLQIISALPEPVIVSASEGADIKLIGTLDDKSMYSIFVAKDIKTPADLKGKIAATNVPGNGTDIQLQYWLKKNGLEPNKDIRLINSGENSGRLEALKTGHASVTILSQPTDLKAEELGLTRIATMRDELKTYNHNMLATKGEIIKKQPEILKAFMSAQAEAVKFIKDPANRQEIVSIVMEKLEIKKADAEKSVDFVLPASADAGKMNIEGVKWAISTTKETGALKKDVAVEQIVDESFYAK